MGNIDMAPKGLVQGAKAPSPALLANEIIYSLITKSPSQSSAGRGIFVCPQERTFASITPPTKPFTRNTSTAPDPTFYEKEAAEDPTPGNESPFRITVPVLQGTFRRAYADLFARRVSGPAFGRTSSNSANSHHERSRCVVLRLRFSCILEKSPQ